MSDNFLVALSVSTKHGNTTTFENFTEKDHNSDVYVGTFRVSWRLIAIPVVACVWSVINLSLNIQPNDRQCLTCSAHLSETSVQTIVDRKHLSI